MEWLPAPRTDLEAGRLRLNMFIMQVAFGLVDAMLDATIAGIYAASIT